MGLGQRDTKYHTYADYCAWPDEVRYELIDGVAYAMTGPSRVHQEVLLEMAIQIRSALDGLPCRPYIAPFDILLPRGNEDASRVDTVVQPDLVVVCDRSKLNDRYCLGAPDWVVEILSPSTASLDHIQKRALYERAGVREYWLVHPVDRMVTIYRLEDGRYGRPDVFALTGRLPVGILPAIEIDWEQVFRE